MPEEQRDDENALLADWFDSALGARVLATERELLDVRLPQLYGFHLMQLGISDRLRLCDSSMIRHRFVLARSPAARAVSACAELERLPIDADSVDVALLHHVLEYSAQPHQLLRETARVVVPHGHLLVLGFNPWSLFGLRAGLARRVAARPVWHGATLAVRRVKDWARTARLRSRGCAVSDAHTSVRPRTYTGPTRWRRSSGRSSGAPGGRDLHDSCSQTTRLADAGASCAPGDPPATRCAAARLTERA
jgi:SAM-dependent methyltransferase